VLRGLVGPPTGRGIGASLLFCAPVAEGTLTGGAVGEGLQTVPLPGPRRGIMAKDFRLRGVEVISYFVAGITRRARVTGQVSLEPGGGQCHLP